MTRNVTLVKKVCLVGDSGVGKTSLIRRFVLDIFDDSYLTTIGAKITKKNMVLDLPEYDCHVDLCLLIWDIAGQKEFGLFHEMYLQGVEGAFIVADSARRETFFSVPGIVDLIDRHGDDIPTIILMNKCDLAEPPAIDLKEIRDLANRRGMALLSTSAKSGVNVQLAFEGLGKMVAVAWAKKEEWTVR